MFEYDYSTDDPLGLSNDLNDQLRYAESDEERLQELMNARRSAMYNQPHIAVNIPPDTLRVEDRISSLQLSDPELYNQIIERAKKQNSLPAETTPVQKPVKHPSRDIIRAIGRRIRRILRDRTDQTQSDNLPVVLNNTIPSEHVSQNGKKTQSMQTADANLLDKPAPDLVISINTNLTSNDLLA